MRQIRDLDNLVGVSDNGNIIFGGCLQILNLLLSRSRFVQSRILRNSSSSSSFVAMISLYSVSLLRNFCDIAVTEPLSFRPTLCKLLETFDEKDPNMLGGFDGLMTSVFTFFFSSSSLALSLRRSFATAAAIFSSRLFDVSCCGSESMVPLAFT